MSEYLSEASISTIGPSVLRKTDPRSELVTARDDEFAPRTDDRLLDLYRETIGSACYSFPRDVVISYHYAIRLHDLPIRSKVTERRLLLMSGIYINDIWVQAQTRQDHSCVLGRRS